MLLRHSNVDLLPRFIELETSTFCNRQCSWCPNSLYDRGRKQVLIDRSLFNKIIHELHDIKYCGQIALHNYNEPLLDPRLFENINSLVELLPSCEVLILTNGDRMNRALCERLQDSRVSLLRVTLYQSKQIGSRHHQVASHARKCGISDDFRVRSSPFGNSFATSLGSMKVIYYIPEDSKFTSRGGTLGYKVSNDKQVCYLPLASCAIDVEGNMKVCCEIYPASQLHRENGIIGNLANDSFLNLWLSKRYCDIRRNLLKQQNLNKVCLACSSKPKNAYLINNARLQRWGQHLALE